MKIQLTELPGVAIVEPAVFADERGWFMETFNDAALAQDLAARGLHAPDRFVQDNHSGSAAGVLRGLHFQRPPHAQGKLVRVVRGAAFDVAVDLRRGSAAFGRWTGVELSAANRRQLWIPPGLAHGFLALEDGTEVVYKTTAPYVPESERTIRWDDPSLAIRWPLAPGQAPRLSPRDAAAPAMADVEVFA